ncbi:phage SPO1 DNA polymerase-related protein [Desulforamulus reducens MI-1]|uniref:Type-4 uracil-DNA glycosylase n=1 Tax=Desulforamulus reducens (strain ATCC BAA-1160 / DSM 100696 / MI-1) TaxID=349161 RepID=A4J916_DESRM|nr:uracil-DNA glycosylase [Desulforamulus reducens]ABO51569.1 phage SPO1 DNA polymerase-related protein [Desulforamulus reducens MI-1]
MSLEQLAKDMQNCTRCGLSEGRNKLVFGVGNPKAKLMLIGEGPGKDEDEQGVPFVGRAGQLLDRILAAIDLTREDVYIANIVKCRPPNNRVPNRVEAKACLPYLYRQIELIQPQIIVLLGNTALQNLIGPDARITKMRGQWLESQSGIKIIATYHPAAVLRDPNRRRPVWEDFQMVQEEYHKLKGNS